MILVDTAVWIGHFQAPVLLLSELLGQQRVLCHPFIVGELACGRLRQREEVIADLTDLPSAVVAQDGEVLALIDRAALFGRGLSYIDIHLLASVRLTGGASLWTRDKRLNEAALRLSIAARLHH